MVVDICNFSEKTVIMDETFDDCSKDDFSAASDECGDVIMNLGE